MTTDEFIDADGRFIIAGYEVSEAVWQRFERLYFIQDFLYEALGPANDEVLDMALERADEEFPQ